MPPRSFDWRYSLLEHGPRIVEAAFEAWERIRDRKQPDPPPDTPFESKGTPLRRSSLEDEVIELRTRLRTLGALEPRVNTLEAHEESQAQLIAQMTQYGAALLRWIILVAVVSVVAGGIAIAALIVTVLR